MTSPAEPQRVFLYVRVSTDRQSQEGHSLADQEVRLRGYAQSIGLPVTCVFIEAGVSGAKQLRHRPKGAELLATVRQGDHVIANKLDRMFRSASDALNVAEDFRTRGIHLHLLDIGGEVTGTGVAHLVFAILAAVGQMERERIGERVRSVKRHLRDAGYFTGGRLARGYRVTDDRKIQPDVHWADCLNVMRDLRKQRLPYRQIAQRLNHKFGLAINHATVFRILNGKREVDAISQMPINIVSVTTECQPSRRNSIGSPEV